LGIEIVQKPTLNEAFLDWMQRLGQCTAINGGDFEEAEKSIAAKITFSR
jgi:hypothetical protein